MSIDSINSFVRQFTPSASYTQDSRWNRFAGSATHEDALEREVRKADEEKKAQKEAKAQLSTYQKTGIDYVKDYIKSYGAPEDLDRAEKQFIEDILQNGVDPDKSAHLQGLAFQNIVKIMQDPTDEGKISVVTTKVDGSGRGKVSVSAKFDSGDGEDRSQLTSARKKAAEAYKQAGGADQPQGSQGSVTEKNDSSDKTADE